jgi:ribosomal protein L16/L10AE
MSNSIEFPQKTKNRTSERISNSASEYISKGNEIKIIKICLIFHVHCSIIHSALDTEKPKCSSWMNEENIYKMCE